MLLADFRRLLTARFLFEFAVDMQAVIMGWLVYELTKDPLYLGLMGLTEAVPALGLALYAGYLVDRSRPLVVYRWVLTGGLASSLILLGTQIFAAQISLSTQIVALFLAGFTSGIAAGFSQPAIYSAVPRLIARSDLAQASAWTGITMHVARISGPAIGGMVFGFFGAKISAVVISSTLVLGIFSVLRIRTKIMPPEARSPQKSLKDELLVGVRFVFSHPILLPALSLDMFSVLFGGVTAILPIYAADILMVGPKGLGLLRAAPAIGAVLVSWVLTKKTFGAGAGKILLSSVAGFGLCILVFAVSTNIWLSIAALAVSGGLDSVSMVIRGAAVQLSSPDEMRGRISAVNSIFIGSSNELGQFESGVAARLLGTVPSVFAGGLACLVTVGVMAIFCPKLRRMDLKALAESSQV